MQVGTNRCSTYIFDIVVRPALVSFPSLDAGRFYPMKKLRVWLHTLNTINEKASSRYRVWVYENQFLICGIELFDEFLCTAFYSPLLYTEYITISISYILHDMSTCRCRRLVLG